MKSSTQAALPFSLTFSTAPQPSTLVWMLRQEPLLCKTQAQSVSYLDLEWQEKPRFQVSLTAKLWSPSLAGASIRNLTIRSLTLTTRPTRWYTIARITAFPYFGSSAERPRWTRLSSIRLMPKPKRYSLTTTGASPELTNRAAIASIPILLLSLQVLKIRNYFALLETGSAIWLLV